MSPLLTLIRSTAARYSARAWLTGFAVALAADLSAITLGADAARWVTKPALMLLLLGFLTVSAPPGNAVARLFGVGLVFAWTADIALLAEGTPAFLTGMALFGVMQAVYLVVFVRAGALEHLRRRWPAPTAYLVFWAVVIVALWPRLDGLAAPIAAYSLLLVAMGAVSSGLGLRAAVGGALFVLSDLMLGLGVAGLDFPLREQAVMATYGAAQLLIVLGCLRSPAFEPVAAARPARA
ncbi:MAG TPA: lysoplasmalogenase [Glycomyces sp.]|nr:lysoplasmalogenase [Glycomyces sp.]